MARRPDLENVALRLVRILGADECMLVGGLAVGAHGYVRGTADVDLIVKASVDGQNRPLMDTSKPATTGS